MAKYHFYKSDLKKTIKSLGKDFLLEQLREMMKIRNFEVRAESGYQQGHIGGFFHSYTGQEAIATSLVAAIGKKNWWIATYRCHAIALLLGVSSKDIMAELYGKESGNAKGRGGSMHLYSDRLLGGFGIVGGQIPIAAGAAFSIKYRGVKDEIAVCFLGDGAVAQGTFHESINLAALWELPCLFVIENNKWGMGTAVNRAISAKRLAEDIAPSYGLKGYTLDGTDFVSCYECFRQARNQILKEGRPILIEAVAERFRGHSISDPGFYRSKEDLKEAMSSGPIVRLRDLMIDQGMLDEKSYKEMDKELREEMIEAMKYASENPDPNTATLEEGVFAP